MNKTFLSSSNHNEKKWYLVDMSNRILGRTITEIATILIGKHKINYHPSFDIGDYVIIINAEDVILTGSKTEDKLYFSHSGRPGGSRIETFKELNQRIPERIIEKAVKGMLPKGRLGRTMFKRLKVYNGGQHPHIAQNPELLNL